MKVNIKFKRGYKSNMPSYAPDGMPLWCSDTKELYMGTGSSISKISSGSSTSLFSHFYESSQYEYVIKSFVTINHNLGLTNDEIKKAFVVPCLICTTEVAGYSLNQIIPQANILAYASYPIPQPYILSKNTFTQRTGDSYAFWINRYNRNYSYHYITTSDITKCFRYFVRIWY